MAFGGGAIFGGEAQRESSGGANGVRPILAAVAAVGDSDPHLHDLARVVEAHDDGREQRAAPAGLAND